VVVPDEDEPVVPDADIVPDVDAVVVSVDEGVVLEDVVGNDEIDVGVDVLALVDDKVDVGVDAVVLVDEEVNVGVDVLVLVDDEVNVGVDVLATADESTTCRVVVRELFVGSASRHVLARATTLKVPT
jgi:hypothetical protein